MGNRYGPSKPLCRRYPSHSCQERHSRSMVVSKEALATQGSPRALHLATGNQTRKKSVRGGPGNLRVTRERLFTSPPATSDPCGSTSNAHAFIAQSPRCERQRRIDRSRLGSSRHCCGPPSRGACNGRRVQPICYQLRDTLQLLVRRSLSGTSHGHAAHAERAIFGVTNSSSARFVGLRRCLGASRMDAANPDTGWRAPEVRGIGR
jgi:hypothetical protein